MGTVLSSLYVSSHLNSQTALLASRLVGQKSEAPFPVPLFAQLSTESCARQALSSLAWGQPTLVNTPSPPGPARCLGKPWSSLSPHPVSAPPGHLPCPAG